MSKKNCSSYSQPPQVSKSGVYQYLQILLGPVTRPLFLILIYSSPNRFILGTEILRMTGPCSLTYKNDEQMRRYIRSYY